MASGEWRIVVGLAVLAAVPARAQQAAPPAATPSESPADTPQADATADPDIVVTGSRTQPGAVFGDIKPELQLGPADIRSYGVSSISDLLGEIAPQTQSDRSSGPPVVLLNGRRISGFAEIRDIPTEAIARVDILPEEVGLKYGYTADSRVVNIVLRPRFRSKTVEGGGGAATEGGAANEAASADYLRIQKNGRLNVDAKYNHADGLSEADRGIVTAPPHGPLAPSGDIPDLAAARSLNRETDTASLNAVYNHVLPGGVSATANARFEYDSSHGENGYATTLLTVPPGPFGPPANPAEVLRYVPDIGPLLADTRTTQLHFGATLNGDGSRWHWSLLGNFDRTDTRSSTETGADASEFQALVTAGGNPLAPFGGLAVPRPRDTADSVAQGGSIDGLLSGKLVKLPGGDANISLKLIGSTNAFDATSTAWRRHDGHPLQPQSRQRPGQFRRAGHQPQVGLRQLRGGFHAQRQFCRAAIVRLRHADDGRLRLQLGAGAAADRDRQPHHRPRRADRAAAAGAARRHPRRRRLRSATGTTALVSVTSGGTTSLTASTRNVTKFELNLKPLKKPDLTFTANYIRTRFDNAIAAFPATSAAIEAAFPERFVRDGSGALVSLDARPVNFAHEATDTLRLGANLSIPLKSQANPVRRCARRRGWRAARRR